MELADNSTYNYATLLRSIFCTIEHRYQERKKKNPEVPEAIVFKIDPIYTAETFLCGIFLLEDTSDAIDNYIKFGLDGPTKYKDIGENYLRLYGLLNAVYMQFVCCREFYNLFKVPNPKEYNKQSEQLSILKLRHAAASHSVNYTANRIRDFFKISQMTVKGHGEKLHVIGEKESQYEFNLKEELESFNQFLNNHLSKVSLVLINRYFNKNSSKYNEYMKKLELIDAKANGDLIIEGANGTTRIFSSSEVEQEYEDLVKYFDNKTP